MGTYRQQQRQKRNKSIDLLRGIGIIAVVLGHVLVSEDYYSYSADCIRRFCYMFHLPLFFFCSGYLYKRTGLFSRIKKLFQNYYLPFVMVGCISLVLYPFWRMLGIIGNESSEDLLFRFFGILSLHIDGFFMQPMWFLVIFGACQLEYGCFDLLLKRQKNIVRCITSLMVGLCGICLVHFFGKGECYVFLALTMLPLMEIGKWYQKIQQRVQSEKKLLLRYLPLVVILSFATMIMLILFSDAEIELSKCSFFGGVGFYPVITIGIILCLSVGEMLEGGNTKLHSVVKEALCMFGRYSFWIMCGHVTTFKVIDGIAGAFLNADSLTLQQLPWSFPRLRSVYFIAGVIIPVVIGATVEKKKAKLRGA